LTERASFDLTAEDLDTTRKLVAEGWHTVEIDDADDELETSNGNQQYLLKYKSTNESFSGQLWDYVAVTQKSIQNILSVARAAGLPVPTKEKPGKFVLPDPDDLIGKIIQVEVVHEDDHKGATDDEGNVIKRAKVRFAGRKKEGEKVGKAAAKATTGKAPAKGAKAKATETDGFTI
jgi:hypothetical protein